MKIKNILKSIVVLELFLIPTFIIAGGTNFNSIRSSKTLSLGGLYFSGLDGVSSIYSNPANLSELVDNSIEFYMLDKVQEYDFNSTSGASNKSYNDDSFNFSLGGVYRLGSDFIIGIGYNNVFNYNVAWPYLINIKSPTNTSVQTYNISQEFILNAATISASYKWEDFSVGISANVFTLTHLREFYQVNPDWKNNIGLAGYQFKYDLDDVGFGMNAGMNYKINNSTKVSLLVKQGTSFSLDGEAESNMLSDLDSAKVIVGVKSDFEIPWSFGFGLLYDINEKWKMNFDLLYSLWGSTSKNINYEFNDAKWSNYTFQPDSISGYNPRTQILDFKNVLEAGIGIEYFNPSGVNLRAGYKYSASQNSDNSYNYLNPNIDEHWLTAGIGFKYEKFTIDAAIAVIIGTERSVAINGNNVFSGNYSSRGYYPSLNINYKF